LDGNASSDDADKTHNQNKEAEVGTYQKEKVVDYCRNALGELDQHGGTGWRGRREGVEVSRPIQYSLNLIYIYINQGFLLGVSRIVEKLELTSFV